MLSEIRFFRSISQNKQPKIHTFRKKELELLRFQSCIALTMDLNLVVPQEIS